MASEKIYSQYKISPKGGEGCVPPLEVYSGGKYLSAENQYNVGTKKFYAIRKIGNFLVSGVG